MKVNRVCHYEGGSSNKVYIGCISKVNGKYIVVGKWGGVAKKISQQTKGTYDTVARAEVARDAFLSTKMKKGYVDIESPAYTGELHMNHVWLRQYLEDEPSVETEPSVATESSVKRELSEEVRVEVKALIRQGKKINAIRRIREDTHCGLEEGKSIAEQLEGEIKSERKSEAKELVEKKVVCVDAVGLEHFFDEGEAYVMTCHPEEDMIYVIDRNGERQECFKERFKKESELKFKEFKAGDSIKMTGEPLGFRKHF